MNYWFAYFDYSTLNEKAFFTDYKEALKSVSTQREAIMKLSSKSFSSKRCFITMQNFISKFLKQQVNFLIFELTLNFTCEPHVMAFYNRLETILDFLLLEKAYCSYYWSHPIQLKNFLSVRLLASVSRLIFAFLSISEIIDEMIESVNEEREKNKERSEPFIVDHSGYASIHIDLSLFEEILDFVEDLTKGTLVEIQSNKNNDGEESDLNYTTAIDLLENFETYLREKTMQKELSLKIDFDSIAELVHKQNRTFIIEMDKEFTNEEGERFGIIHKFCKNLIKHRANEYNPKKAVKLPPNTKLPA